MQLLQSKVTRIFHTQTLGHICAQLNRYCDDGFFVLKEHYSTSSITDGQNGSEEKKVSATNGAQSIRTFCIPGMYEGKACSCDEVLKQSTISYGRLCYSHTSKQQIHDTNEALVGDKHEHVEGNNGHHKLAAVLLVGEHDYDGEAPLIRASFIGYLDMVDFLLEKTGADVNRADKDGYTALHRACQAGHKDVVARLLVSGADTEKQTKAGWTALQLASANCRKEVMELLHKSPGNKPDPARLLLAAQTGDKHAVFHELLDGADANSIDKDGRTVLYLACQAGQIQVASLLLEWGAVVDKPANDGSRPLSSAIASGQKEVAELLLKNGADVDGLDKDGRTHLWWASYRGHKEMADLLLTIGADANRADKDGSTPLRWASHKGSKEVVELLMKSGADTNKADKDERTPLLLASNNGHVEVVELLLAHGADVNMAYRDNGVTPLVCASGAGHRDVVTLLLRSGADINAVSKDGKTALTISRESRKATWNAGRQEEYKQVEALLLQHGAN